MQRYFTHKTERLNESLVFCMAIAETVAPEIQSIYQAYRSELQTIRLSHEQSTSPVEIVRDITTATDTLILKLLIDHLKRILGRDELPPNMLLLAQGGYGRREMHPHSDVDIIFLYQTTLSPEQEELVKVVFRTLFDLGFTVGHSCRSFREALEMARTDPHSQTALTESRFLSGDWRLFEEFKERLWRFSRRRRDDIIRNKTREREERLSRHGSTINITEPNLKESPGGLRDYHFGIWIGSLLAGRTMKLIHMKRVHMIDDEMMSRIEQSVSFLWRLRTELHFLTGKEQDMLAMPLQHDVSLRLGYVDKEGRLAEECMMRDYYSHAYILRGFADRMAKRATRQSLLTRFRLNTRRPLSDGFYIRNNEIHAPQTIHFFEHYPPRILQTFIHSAVHQKHISEETLNAIRDNLDLIDQAFTTDRHAASMLQRFFQLQCDIEEALQAMRFSGVLERIFPEWKGISFLVRYDLAHRFTVDEHSLLCLYNLEQVDKDTMSHTQERVRLWKLCEHKDVLRLAVLFHDVGKGRNADHSIVGAELVDGIARRMRLSDKKRKQLVFLVRYHLIMNRTAQHRDISDPEVTADFCDSFDRPEDLDMLYLLTYVDVRSVSPDAMTEWKNNLLWQLYAAARRVFYSDPETTERMAVSRKESLITKLSRSYNKTMIQKHLDALPPSYMMQNNSATLNNHLKSIEEFDGDHAIIHLLPLTDPNYREMVIVTRDRVGLFNRICTAVLLENFGIVEARLNTRTDGIVCNSIIISNDIEDSEITPTREEMVKQRVIDVIASSGPLPPIPPDPATARLGRTSFKNQAKVLNDISSRYSVLEIQGSDHRGLLQGISSVLSSMNINIHFARIITQSLRVIDVFYISDSNGAKIEDKETIKRIQDTILALLD